MNWDDYFLTLCDVIAIRSKDTSRKIGCVIVGHDNEVVSTGYNSFPRGIIDNVPARFERPEKYFWFEHAERNGIYNAARHGTALKGCRIYTRLYPCTDCARGIIQSGIIEVICPEPDWDSDTYAESFRRTKVLFEESGVKTRWIKLKNSNSSIT